MCWGGRAQQLKGGVTGFCVATDNIPVDAKKLPCCNGNDLYQPRSLTPRRPDAISGQPWH